MWVPEKGVLGFKEDVYIALFLFLMVISELMYHNPRLHLVVAYVGVRNIPWLLNPSKFGYPSTIDCYSTARHSAPPLFAYITSDIH